MAQLTSGFAAITQGEVRRVALPWDGVRTLGVTEGRASGATWLAVSLPCTEGPVPWLRAVGTCRF